MSHISLGSSNLQNSISFYGDILDFEVLEQDTSYTVLRLDPISIRLNQIDGYRSQVQNPGHACLTFILDVDDFTKAIQELEEKDIEILQGPVAIEGGESILIADPDGNLIELFYKE